MRGQTARSGIYKRNNGKGYQRTSSFTGTESPSTACWAMFFVLASSERVMLVPRKGYFARDSGSARVSTVKETLVFLDRTHRTCLKVKLVIDPRRGLAV